jgi:beta-glucanase (GH16 family)
MKQILPAAILLSLSTLPAFAAESQNGSGETNGYTLVWQDLFDADQLNTQRWTVEVNGNGGGNSELQYYTDRTENVSLKDDGKGNHCLVLTARRENYAGRNFTSGRINSQGKIAFTHGKVEASIKMPSTANGLWPAFWMMGNDYNEVGWPKCGETDIVEMGHSDGFNGTQDRYFNGACHWGQGWPQCSYAKSSTYNYSLQDGEFHLFTLIWDEQSIAMYVDLDKYPDVEPYYKMDIPDNQPNNADWPGNYFHKNNFILFNLAVGGGFPGIYDANGITALNDANGNEASMYINYVKVYQKGLSSDAQDFKDAGDVDNGDTPSNPGTGDNGDDNPSDDDTPSDPGNYDGYACNPSIAQVISNDANSVYYMVLSDAAVTSLNNAGITTKYIGTDDNAGRYLYLWGGFDWADNSSACVDGGTSNYYSVSVNGALTWSGAGLYLANGENLSSINDNTHFHVAYKSITNNGPASIGLRVMETGYLALGTDFDDNGVIYPSAGPAISGEWQAIDITIGQIKALNPSFAPANLSSWTGNIFSWLGGSVAGQTIAIDALYFYNASTSGIDAAAAPTTNLVVTGSTINSSANGIALYDLSGKLVKSTASSVLGIEELSRGIYIVRSQDIVKKIVIR